MLTESHTCDTLSRYSAKRNLHHADFFCHAPEATQVSIIGNFNNWKSQCDPGDSPTRRPMDSQLGTAARVSPIRFLGGWQTRARSECHRKNKRFAKPTSLTRSHQLSRNKPMDPLPIIALVTIATLYGLVWHDQPARNPEKTSLPEIPARPQEGRKA